MKLEQIERIRRFVESKALQARSEQLQADVRGLLEEWKALRLEGLEGQESQP